MLSRRPVSPLQLRAGSWAPAFLDVGVFLAPTPPIRPRGLLQRWGQWECTEVDQQLPRQHPALAQRRNMGPKSGKAIISLYHLPNLVPAAHFTDGRTEATSQGVSWHSPPALGPEVTLLSSNVFLHLCRMHR